MLPEKIISSLSDIKTSIDSIEDYLSEFMDDRRDFNIYMQHKRLRRSVERELEIIGEATRRITKVGPEFKLENTREIIGLRNLVAHAYDNISDNTIWAIINKHLPKLRKDVERLLAQVEK
jgi:uncharacterized protein with HEPN domain